MKILFFSKKLNEAKLSGKKINYNKVKSIFLKHILSGLDFYENLGRNTLGCSPKHIILLHDKDATVLFLDDLVKEMRKRGWKIISAKEAIEDPLYRIEPKNTNSTFGLISQIASEKALKFRPYYDFNKLKKNIKQAIDAK